MLKNNALVLALLCMLSSTASASPLTVTTGDYPPFSSESYPHLGFAQRIVAHAAEAAGLEIKFLFRPWKRALEEARTGNVFASSFWLHKPEREKDFFHVGPLFDERIAFFHRKDNKIPKWSSLSDLADMSIGATIGYTYTSEFWKLSENGTLRVEPAKSDLANLKKVLHGRIDLFISGRLVGWQVAADHFTPEEVAQLTTTKQEVLKTSTYLLVSRKYPNAEAIANALQDNIDSMRAKGLIARFMRDMLRTLH